MIFTCMILLALDGDTKDCDDGRRVRLWGIDAPEIEQTGGTVAQEALGRFAGARATCEAKGRSYGRTVGKCKAIGVDMSCFLIGSGVAEEWIKFSGGAYSQC